ncbi:NACHT domain-containing protein [Streptomyces rectiviolaceus]|uniref:NACHT domain-containing protein n=1 Tax=Streptomyces rectiviolaceus TaxID=332591 RepID=UPI0031DED556
MATIWALQAGLSGDYRGADWAAVIGVPLTLYGLLLARTQNRAEPDVDKVIEELVSSSKKRWGPQRYQLLGRDHHAINLSFQVMDEPSGAPADPGQDCHVEGIVAFYRAQRRRRLVITGSPGAGKTFLTIELVLGLLHDDTADGPIPIRLALTDWDTGIAFEVWLVKRIAAEYGVVPHSAQLLVDKRRILPVLDGLDEMDAGSDPDAAAPRAIAVMKALDAYLGGHGGAPVVLACRSGHYRALADSGHALAQSTRIQIAPLTAGQARGYLTRRSTTPAGRLAVLLDALDASDPAAPVPWLSTPWRVTLVAAALAGGTHPRELLSHVRRGLAAADEYLIGLYVSSAAALHPLDTRHRYSPRDAERWLGELARYLRDSGKQAIVLHELWGLERGHRAKAVAALTGTLLGVLLFTPWAYANTQATTPWASGSVGFNGLLCLVFGASLGAFTASDPQGPRMVRFVPVEQHWQAVAEFRTCMRACLHALLCTVASFGALVMSVHYWPNLYDRADNASSSYWSSYLHVVFLSLVAVAVGWPAFALLARLSGIGVSGWAVLTGKRPVVIAVHPGSTLPGSPLRPMRRVLLTGAVAATGVAALFTLQYTSTALPTWVGITANILVLFGWGVLAEPARWCAWYLAFRLWACGRLPWRTGAFLNWAAETGLLRVAGLAYEFRHHELRAWLTERLNRPPTAN